MPELLSNYEIGTDMRQVVIYQYDRLLVGIFIILREDGLIADCRLQISDLFVLSQRRKDAKINF